MSSTKFTYTLLFLLSMNCVFSQKDSSKINSLESIHNFCKHQMNGKVWFDFNACDLNSLIIYQDDAAYSLKLSGIEKITMETVVEVKRSLFSPGGYRTTKLKTIEG